MEAGRKYHVGELRSRLLREARGMLDEGQPLHLRALAARAGITAGSMYHHYENKTELLGELAAGAHLRTPAFMGPGQPLARLPG